MTPTKRSVPNRHSISVGTLAWIAAAAIFAGMRILAISRLPVGGIELWSLSGAWQARAGIDESRYVPTLFQAATAALLRLDDSETLPRALAFAASLSVPLSLFALRERLGQPAALAALLILAFDPLHLALGATAQVAALDLPLALAVVAAWNRVAKSPALLALAGFLLATAGPGVLPVVFASVAAAPHVSAISIRPAVVATVGAVTGVAVASLGFGSGWQGLVVPPLDLFAAGFDSHWSTETTRRLLALYAWTPAVFAGVSLGFLFWRLGLNSLSAPFDRLIAAWFGLALGWSFVAGASRDPLPIASLTAASALLAGQGLSSLVEALGGADWRRAGWPLAAALLATVTLLGPLLDWASVGRIGPDSEVAAAVILSGVAAGGFMLLLRLPATRPVALLPLAAAAATPWISGGFAVAAGSPNEPLPSPVTTLQASEIRDLVRGTTREPTGIVAIHPSLAEALTWPLRQSRGLVATSRISPNASVIIWKPDGSPPDGFRSVDGRWAVLRERNGPKSGFLDYLGWLADRNTLPVRDVPAAVSIRDAQ